MLSTCNCHGLAFWNQWVLCMCLAAHEMYLEGCSILSVGWHCLIGGSHQGFAWFGLVPSFSKEAGESLQVTMNVGRQKSQAFLAPGLSGEEGYTLMNVEQP